MKYCHKCSVLISYRVKWREGTCSDAGFVIWEHVTSAASGSHCVINDCYARCIKRYSLSPWLLLNGSVTTACIHNLSVLS